jgi:hypothetical protein
LVLPEKAKFIDEYTFPDDESPNPVSRYEPPKIFFPLLETTTIGKYPEVFGYRYLKHVNGNVIWNIWGLVFWDRILATLLFHDVRCKCQECIEKKY